MARLTINGRTLELNVDPSTPFALGYPRAGGPYRDQVRLRDRAVRGLYGARQRAAVRSCVMPVSAAVGRRITTIEGLASGGVLHKVQKAWLEHDVPQCGFCQSGMIMAAAALLAEVPQPSDPVIDDAMAGNICRCGTFQQVREAIHAAAKA